MSSGGKVTTVGMFDGLHLGHRAIVESLCRYGRDHGLNTEVITFAEHPLKTLKPGREPKRLIDNEMRCRLLTRAGVDRVAVTDFASIRALTAAEFLSRLKAAGTRAFMMGFNNHIGSDRLTAAQADALGIVPVVAVAELAGPTHVSSSAIRLALAEGKVAEAAAMLGRPYSIEGTVVHGKELGRSLGFPTANLEVGDVLLPADGVYAVDVQIPGRERIYRGMANIGVRPTFDDGSVRTVEVNIFGLDESLYGRKLTLSFIGRLRGEQLFADADALRAALERDRLAAQAARLQLVTK